MVKKCIQLIAKETTAIQIVSTSSVFVVFCGHLGFFLLFLPVQFSMGVQMRLVYIKK